MASHSNGSLEVGASHGSLDYVSKYLTLINVHDWCKCWVIRVRIALIYAKQGMQTMLFKQKWKILFVFVRLRDRTLFTFWKAKFDKQERRKNGWCILNEECAIFRTQMSENVSQYLTLKKLHAIRWATSDLRA